MDKKPSNGGKTGFWNGLFVRLTSSLTTRIMSVILVILLPVCIVVLFTMGVVLGRATDQVMDSYQRELALDMDNVVQDMKSIEEGMNDFVSSYLTELNTERYDVNEVTAVNMLKELDGILQRSGLPGYVFLYDLGTGGTKVKYQGLPYDVATQEAQKEKIKLIAQVLKVTDYQVMRINQEDYMAKGYGYRNYRVGFLFHLPLSISNQLAVNYIDGNVYYLGTAPMNLQGNTAAFTEKSWNELLVNNMVVRSIYWQSEEVPLQVCIEFPDFYAIRMIPTANWVLLFIGFSCIFLIPLLWLLLKKEIILPLGRMVHAMEELSQDHLDYRLDVGTDRDSSEIQYLYESFNNMASEIQLSKEKDLKMVKAELDNLRLQVNPHMLLNSFNMIYSLAQTKNYNCIQDYSLHLVEYFRYVLRKNDNFVPVRQELEFIQNYIEIQKIRYPNSFVCVYNVDENCLEAQIPPLLIENFVENSMKYALIPGKTIEVLLNIRRDEDELVISVCDTGRGIRPEILEQIQKGKPYVDPQGNRHIGIWNCMRRVEVFYGEKAKLSIVSTRDSGTQIFLTIPYREEENDESISRG